MADPLTFRSARLDDVPTVLAFWRGAAEDAHRPSDSADALRRLVERDPEALWLAVDGREIVGSLIAGWDGWRFHLYRLAVAPTHRRRGVAQRLLSAAEQRFAEHGATRIDAMVLDENTEAHGFWQAAGYVPQDEWSRWVKSR